MCVCMPVYGVDSVATYTNEYTAVLDAVPVAVAVAVVAAVAVATTAAFLKPQQQYNKF